MLELEKYNIAINANSAMTLYSALLAGYGEDRSTSPQHLCKPLQHKSLRKQLLGNTFIGENDAISDAQAQYDA